MSALEVDAVLRRLPALEVYRANVFRVTGLPTDATDSQARRAREEAEVALRLGAPLPTPYGEAGPKEPPDAHALKSAFEALRNPVLRLVHELFWLWGEPGAHDDAVRAHCRALEAGDAPESAWRSSLALWAEALRDPASWDRMHRRARDLDDPRVGPATVDRLREVAPVRVLAVGAELAAAAAVAADTDGAARHVRVLQGAPFDRGLVVRALADAVRPVEARLRDATEATERAAAAEPAEADAAGWRLLEDSADGLRVLALLLPTDATTAALHDEVAHAAASCAVAHFDATGRSDEALALLAEARGLAHERTTREFVERNRRTIADAQVLAVVAPLREAGNVDGAADVLRLWRRTCADENLRERLDRLADDPRAVRAPVDEAPARSGFLGCGMRPFGRRAVGDDGTWIETRCLSVFGLPVFPLAAYLSDKRYVYAKVPLSPATRWAQSGLLVALAVLVALVGFGPGVAAAAAAVVVAGLLLDVAVHRRKTRGWLADQLAP